MCFGWAVFVFKLKALDGDSVDGQSTTWTILDPDSFTAGTLRPVSGELHGVDNFCPCKMSKTPDHGSLGKAN